MSKFIAPTSFHKSK